MIPVSPYRNFFEVLRTWFAILDKCDEGRKRNSYVDVLLRGGVSAVQFARSSADAWLVDGLVGVDPAAVTEAGTLAARWLFQNEDYDLAAECGALRVLVNDLRAACLAAGGSPTAEDVVPVLAALRAIATFLGAHLVALGGGGGG